MTWCKGSQKVTQRNAAHLAPLITSLSQGQRGPMREGQDKAKVTGK